MKIIGITGNKRVGKDTLCGLLYDIGEKVQRWAFADSLKDDLYDLLMQQFGVDVFTLDGPMKEKLRPILIAYGCSWRAVDPEHWVKVVDDEIDNDEESLHCVVDFRFVNEIEYFRNKYGRQFFLVGIDREGAPEPTEEEQRNWPAVSKLVDHWVKWPTVEPDLVKLQPYAVEVYKKFQEWVS